MANADEIWSGMAKTIDSYGGNLLKSALWGTVAHPIAVARVLVQVGHEPIPPMKGEQWFTKKPLWSYPNMLQYWCHIYRVDGYTGLYRGLGPRLVHDFINQSVGNALLEKMKDEEGVEVDPSSAIVFAKETVKLACVKTTSYIISYPFHVISVRMIAQFAGRESTYSNTLVSLREIYNEEGIGGFFKGLVPGLIGELVMLGVLRFVKYVITNYLLTEELSKVQDIKTGTNGVADICAKQLASPFGVVANVMCVNDTNLAVGKPPAVPIYEHWTECWTSLGPVGRNRTISFLWPYRTIPYHP